MSISFPLVCSGNAPPVTTMIWNNASINTAITIQNETLVIEGNLTIVNNGRLEIVNSLILMNPLANGSCSIMVEDGGAFLVRASRIESGTEFGYLMLLDTGSKSEFEQMAIRNCGYFINNLNEFSGIHIKSDNCTIANSSIYYEDVGLYLESATVDILNTSFMPNYTGQDGALEGQASIMTSKASPSKLTMKQSRIYGALNYPSGYYAGAMLRIDWGESYVENCTIIQSFCYFGKCTINDTRISANANSPMIITDNAGPALFQNCVISNSMYEAVMATQYTTTFVNCTISGGTGDLLVGSTLESNYAIVELVNSPVTGYQIQNNISVLKCYNFLNIKAIDVDNGNGIENVSVKVYDVNKNVIFNNITDNNGEISFIPVLSKTIMKKTTDIYTPHKASASYGNINITIDNIDMNNNQNIIFRFKLTPPTLNITYPPEGLITNQALIYITGQTDSDAILSLNGQGIANQNGQFNASYWLNEGNNSIVIIAHDSFGNTATETRNVTLKTIPPYLEIISPKKGTITNRSPVNITGITNGTRLEINGKNAEIMPNGSFFYLLDLMYEGNQVISVTAWDDAGNFQNIKINIIYDITPPSIQIISPENGTLTNLSIIMFSARVLGASTVYVNNEIIYLDQTGYFQTAINLKDGTNFVTVKAVDLAGNINQTTILIILDNKNQLEITEPANNLLINSTEIVIKGTTDSDAIVTINGNDVVNQNGNFTYVLTLTEGINIINVVSVDRAKNYAYQTLYITVDTIPPILVILEPTESILRNPNVLLKIRSEINSSVTVGGKLTALEGLDVYTCSLNLDKGDNSFVIIAKDAAGNVNTTEIVLTYTPLISPGSNNQTSSNLLLPAMAILVIVIVLIVALIAVRKRQKPT